MRNRIAGMGIALALVGCGLGNPSPSEAVADLEALFPTLEALQVTNVYRTEDCEFIAYEEREFVTDAAAPECDIQLGAGRPRADIDDQARADLDAIYAESDALGQRLHHAYVEFGPDGEIVEATLGFEALKSYVYEPGWTTLPGEESQSVNAVNEDWYEVSF